MDHKTHAENTEQGRVDESASSEGQHVCQAALTELKEKYTYLAADFDTYRRRVMQERAQAVQQAQASILRDVVALYDDLSRALSVGSGASNEGVALVHKNCAKLLESHQVVELAQMRSFDPQIHEALAQVPATAEHPAGTIVTVLEKGYTHKGSLLRPARVTVAHEN